MHQPTKALTQIFEKLCNIKKESDVKKAIKREAALKGKYFERRVYLYNYLNENMEGASDELKKQIKEDLAYYRECLAAFQKMARQIAEKKPLKLMALEAQRIKELLSFSIPAPSIVYAHMNDLDTPVTYEIEYPPFMPDEAMFPFLSACTLFLCQIPTKQTRYHLTTCEFTIPFSDGKRRCGKILLRQRKPKSGYQPLCRSHQTYKSKQKHRQKS